MKSSYTSRLAAILSAFVFGLLLTSFLAPTAQAQVEKINEEITVIHATRHDVSKPLREVDVSELPPMYRGEENVEILNESPSGEAGQKPKGFIDPALQGNEGNMSQPTILKNFDGLGVADDDEVIGFRVAPPDPNIEVGDQYIVEMVNLVTAVYDKSGNLVMDPVPNNSFWSGFGGPCENSNAGDPIVLYDQAEDRWIISQFANPGASDAVECVAVSQTSDPTGSYYRYEFPTNGNDYPKMGVGTEAYYLSWRDFAGGGGAMSAAALDKEAMLQGNDATMITFGPDSGVFTRPPADIDGTLPSADTPHPFPALGSDAVSIYGFNPDFANPENSTFEELANISVDPFDSEVCGAFRGQCVPQPNGPDLETLSGVLMHRPNVRDMGDHLSMVANHTVDVGSERAGVRWYEFRNDGSGWTLHQQGTYAPEDGLHRWMGSIAINPDGSIALGYSVSSSSQKPAVRFTGRPSGAPLGDMTFQETEIFESPTSQKGTSRWGDYTAMVTDAANPGTFWYVGEFASDDFSDFNWDTRIASFKFEVDDSTPPEAITDLSATPAGPVNVDLSWTAPSDPPDGDPAGSYDIRYSTEPIQDTSDFENATQVEGEPAPAQPGQQETFTVGGLQPDTEYFFAIRSVDFVGNVSDLSNVPSATTEPAPVISTNPDSVTRTLNTGESGSETLSILNEGEGLLTFSLTTPVGGTQISDPLGDLGEPSAPANYPKGQHETSAGEPPENGKPTVKNPQQMIYQPDLSGTTYYGVNFSTGSFVSFQGNQPETLNQVGSYPGAFANAGDFPRLDKTVTYDLDNDGVLRKINVETGEVTKLGNVGVTGWCGMTTDPSSGTVYVNTCTSLYTLDPDAVEVTKIGDFGIDFMIDIAVDGQGQMWGYGLNNDVLYEINKQTAEITEVGPIGFDANFGQGLTWDTKNQVLLMSAFNDATFQAEWRSVNRQTGSTELIGVLGGETPGGSNQLGWVATPIEAFGDWLSATPTQGEIQGGGSKDITLDMQTTFEEEGVENLIGGFNYFADVAIESNDPLNPTTNVPVTLTVKGNPAIGFSDDPLDFGEVFSGTSQTDTLGITNESDDAILQVANLQIDSEVFTLVDTSDFVLNPGESMKVPITFSPSQSKAYEATLSLASSAGDQEVGLVGQGVPFVSISPDSLSQTIDLTTGDSTATQEFTVTNEFDEELPFDVIIETLEGGTGNVVDLTPKLTDEKLRRYRRLQQRPARPTEGETSAKPAPQQKDDEVTPMERILPETQTSDPTGVTAYANDFLGENIVSFDIGVPGEFTPVDDFVDSFAGNFAFANNDQIFWIENGSNKLKTYALDDGTVETVGTLSPKNSEASWTDMETDPSSGTTYVTTAFGDFTTRLYEVDLEEAELTPIGTFNGLGIALAIDADGVGYVHEITNDEIRTIDLKTASTTVLGPTGIDANFAQSMTWDGETGQVLMAALHDCGFFGCNAGTLRQVNRETGNTTAIGSFPDGGNNELTWFATPSIGVPWLSTNLNQGILPAGASLTLQANYDASETTEGNYNAQVRIVGSDLQGKPDEALPVNLSVEAAPILSLSKNSLSFDSTFVDDTTATQMVTLRNNGLADMNITDVSIDTDDFWRVGSGTSSPDSTFTIEPGDAKIFEIAFTPTETGDLAGTLSFEGEEVSGEVSLSGTGIPKPILSFSPQSFEKQAYVGQQQEETVTVTNDGGNPLEFKTAPILSDDANTLLDEGFDGDTFPPEGWSRAGVNDGKNWVSTKDSFCSFFFEDQVLPGACFYWFPSNVGAQRLVTPQMNTEGRNKVALQFEHQVDNFSFDPAYELRLETSSDGGQTWTTVKTFPAEDFGPKEEMVIIENKDVGSAQFQVAWTFEGDSFQINSWGVDDVRVAAGADWLAVTPNQGTVQPGNSTTLDLSIDASGLNEGTYESGLNLDTNDPVAQTEQLPFILNVIEEVSVAPHPSTPEVFPNQDFAVDYNVESLNDLEVFSYEMKMGFNPDRMQVQEVVTEGTLSEGLTVTSNIDNETGTVSVVAVDGSGGSGPDGEGTGGDQPLFDIEGQGTLISVDATGQPDHGEMTLDMQKMLFNEGEPPAATKDSTTSVVPLYGDVDLNLSITTMDASKVLDFAVDKIDLGETQKTHADVSGTEGVSAFDASLILRRTVGDIDCFPVESGCSLDQPLAGKSSSEASSDDGRLAEIFAWGKPSRNQTSAAQSSSSEGTTISVPLKTDQAVWPSSYNSIHAIEVTTKIDAGKVSVEDVKSHLDGWRIVHHVSKDGTLKISMAGTSSLSKVGKVATLTLQRKDSDAQVKVGGSVTINETAGHELKTKSIVSIPDEFALEGTYPNPFRQSATLEMDLPKKANVTVEVYDLLGRKVQTAYNGEMSAGSGRTVRIDGTDLPSGTYFYRARVEMGNTTQTRSGKMTVVQ